MLLAEIGNTNMNNIIIFPTLNSFYGTVAVNVKEVLNKLNAILGFD